MLFLPYRVDVDVRRRPWVTLAVCALCVYVFVQQYESYVAYEEAVQGFCSKTPERLAQIVLRNVEGAGGGGRDCTPFYRAIRDSGDPGARIDELIASAKPLGLFRDRDYERAYMRRILVKEYDRFDAAVPRNLTEDLVYDPTDVRLWRMFTSAISHGDVGHLAGNLYFFYVFAASVELLVGAFAFFGVMLFTALTTALAYSYAVAGSPDTALPTLGLSGVVMGMIALLAVLGPGLRIRCFLWVLLIVRFFSLPALLIATWFVGWDIYHLTTYGTAAPINFVAHVSGAATGALIGLILRRRLAA